MRYKVLGRWDVIVHPGEVYCRFDRNKGRMAPRPSLLTTRQSERDRQTRLPYRTKGTITGKPKALTMMFSTCQTTAFVNEAADKFPGRGICEFQRRRQWVSKIGESLVFNAESRLFPGRERPVND